MYYESLKGRISLLEMKIKTLTRDLKACRSKNVRFSKKIDKLQATLKQLKKS